MCEVYLCGCVAEGERQLGEDGESFGTYCWIYGMDVFVACLCVYGMGVFFLWVYWSRGIVVFTSCACLGWKGALLTVVEP